MPARPEGGKVPARDTVVRGFYTYGGSLMKRGQLCQPGVDYLVEGPRGRGERTPPILSPSCRRAAAADCRRALPFLRRP